LAAVSKAETPRAGDLFARQDVAGFHPGLLSGLVLAGANQPVQLARDDGILTALEVAALDLAGVELATLSACQTGLGESAGGEGLLGLQRAFQTAGTRSVVASLWKVPDQATQVLMNRFYDNCWRRELGRLQALREAQLWMLHEGAKDKDLLRGGLERVRDQAPGKDGRLSPFYWAAFVLSGDWR
jgi:CHAT domain-containing protein